MTAFKTIVQATNAQVGTAGNFTNISDPNLIVPGQTLCIPAAPGTATANTNTGGAMGTDGNTQRAIPATGVAYTLWATPFYLEANWDSEAFVGK